MIFFDKLNALLLENGILEENLFIHWVIKQAQMECKAEDILIIKQAHDKVSFDIDLLSESDLKKLLILFQLPENTLQKNNILHVSNKFLCDVIFPQFKDYVINCILNINDKKTTVHSETDESEDDGFVFIDRGENNEDDIFETFPWLHSNHPLYFPPSQPNHSNRLTRWASMEKFSVENWYPHLKNYTFESSFVTLCFDDIKYLIGSSSPTYDSTNLERIFDNILSQFSNQEAFMRLSTRSPKDSKSLFNQAARIMSSDFDYWHETDNKNQQLVSFVVAMTKAMKITSGKKIIETIKESPRVYNDLLSLISSSSSSTCQTEIVLRKWYDIRPDHEFRIFVSRRGRKESIVTAISQYFHFLYFDKLPEDCLNFEDEKCKNYLVKKIQKYVLNLIDPAVANFLDFSSNQDEHSIDYIREYILDVALIPLNQYQGHVTDKNQITIGTSTYILMVIELNPFAPAATGALLFNWKTDLNMLWGKAQCEYPVFSYRTYPREDLHSISLLPLNYERVIQNAIAQRLKDSSPLKNTNDRTPLMTCNRPDNQANRFFVSAQPTVASSTDKTHIDSKPTKD